MKTTETVEKETDALYYLDENESFLLSESYIEDFRQHLKSNGVDDPSQRAELVESFEALIALTDEEIASIELTIDDARYGFVVQPNKKSKARWVKRTVGLNTLRSFHGFHLW